MNGIISVIQSHWVSILELAGGIHVILNVIGKLSGNKAIQGLDNLILSLLSTFGVKQGPNA